MSQPHFIYLTGSHAVFLRETGNSISLVGSIARGENDADALERFGTHLKRFAKDVFVFVVDSVSEDLVVEDVPSLRPRDLRAMMARRVEQRVRERKLAAWQAPSRGLLSGALLGGLFAARADAPSGAAQGTHANPAPAAPARSASVVIGTIALDGIEPWIDAALREGARIADVVSPALLATGLSRRLRRGTTAGLIVTITPAGLRQTLFVDGQARFTRLARLADGGADSESIAAECTRTVQYLLMNQLLSRSLLANRQAGVWILTDGIVDAVKLPASLKPDSAGEIAVRKLSAEEAGARRFKGPQPYALGSAQLWADSRLLASAVRGYATPVLRNRHVAASLARTIVGIGLAFSTLGALALGGVELASALSVSPVDPVAARRMQEHRELAALLHRYAVPGSEMRRVVEQDAALRARALDPLLPLQQIAQAMQENRDVRLERLSWARAGATAAVSVVGAGASPSDPAGNALPGAAVSPVAATVTPALAPDALAAATAGANTVDPEGVVEFRLTARIDPLAGKTAANASAQRFVAALSRQCNCSVELVTPPFDPSSHTGFSADLKSRDANAKPEFVVVLRIAKRAPEVGKLSGSER